MTDATRALLDQIEAERTAKPTTPAQVRAELKRRGLPYDIVKQGSSWYVCGGDSHEWRETCLYTFQFSFKNAAWWVDLIEDRARTMKGGA